jgi:hypothetical protein
LIKYASEVHVTVMPETVHVDAVATGAVDVVDVDPDGLALRATACSVELVLLELSFEHDVTINAAAMAST